MFPSYRNQSINLHCIARQSVKTLLNIYDGTIFANKGSILDVWQGFDSFMTEIPIK